MPMNNEVLLSYNVESSGYGVVVVAMRILTVPPRSQHHMENIMLLAAMICADGVFHREGESSRVLAKCMVDYHSDDGVKLSRSVKDMPYYLLRIPAKASSRRAQLRVRSEMQKQRIM